MLVTPQLGSDWRFSRDRIDRRYNKRWMFLFRMRRFILAMEIGHIATM